MLEKLFPFSAAPKSKSVPQVKEPDTKGILKVFKIRSLGIGFNNGLSSYITQDKKRASFEEAPYDFDKIIQAIDTDSYIKQGFNKYQELLWKEGWDIVSENSEAVEYLYERIDLMEIVMGKSFQEFLVEVVDQLVKFHNVFIGIARGDIRPFMKTNLYTKEGQDPISGFYIIPTEQVRILRDKFNKTIAYKQELDETSINGGPDDPIWDAKDVIHLYRDRKPGRPFGTPFVVSALDDVIALRQLEEDVQNLYHKELFPLYKYRVGTEDRPATKEEIEDAATELENFRTQGGLILPERHDVEVVGSEGKALEISEPLSHFKERVAIGLGLSPHHLGMTGGTSNRAVTDRLDIALYDKVKSYQRYVENAIRLHIFNPLLFEGGFNPLTNPADDETESDRCVFRFREIDTDTQVKKETHELNLLNSNGITWEEFRIRLRLDPNEDPDNLMMSMQHKLTIDAQDHQLRTSAEVTPQQKSQTVTKTATGGVSKKTVEPVKPDAAKPSTGGTKNNPNNKRGLGQLMKPSNQHGRRLSPNIRHDDDQPAISEWIDDLVQLIENEGD
jgi:hypothetical protein